MNASGTIKATVKTSTEKSKAARTVLVPGASAAGKAAGGQARAVDARVTWSTLSDMKQRGAIPSAAKTRAADVRTVKPAGSDAVGAKSTQTGAAGMKIKPLDLNNPGANADVNALIGAQGGPGAPGGANGHVGGVGKSGGLQGGLGHKSFIRRAQSAGEAAGEAADQRQGGADSLNESGIVGSIAKARRENEQAGRALMGGLNLNDTSANSALNGMAPVLSSPEVKPAQEGVHWDPLGGLSAQEKTEALMPIIESSDYYRQSKAQIDAQAGALDAEILSLDGQIASLGEESFSEAQELRARRNQLKMQRYYAQDKLDNLADETRVRLTDAGVLKGSLTPEEKIRYDIDQVAKAGGAAGFFETLGRTAATTGHQIVDSTPRDLATTYVTAMAAIAGAQSPADWLEAHPEQKGIFDRAYSPTQDLSDYSGSFGSEGWDTFQKLEQSAAESLKTMAISYGLGAVGAGSAGAGAGHVTRIMQWVNSGLPAAAGAAREAATAGADSHDAGAAFLFTGIANAYLEQGGADKVFENAARLGRGMAGTGAGGKIVSRLCPAGVKKVADAIKSSKYGWIYEAGLDVFKSFFSEGFEEVAEDAVGNAIAKAVYDKDMPWTGEGGVIDGAQYMEDGLIGGSMGAAFTVIGGLLMPGQYRAHLLSQIALDEVKRGMPISKKQIADINAAIDTEIRAGEKSISDVDAHAGIWRANGQEAPESLKNWRAAAENAGKAQSVYEAARRGVEQLISDMESGAVDVSTEQGVKSYNAVMAEYSAASEKLSQAARENVNARDTYYTDEDALSAQVDGKSSAAIERMDEIAQSLNEADGAGDVDARKLNSPEAQEVIRAADEAIMSRDALAGEIEQTVEDEKNAPSPGEALEAIERRRQLSAEYVVARQQAEDVLTQLREAVRNDSPERLNERMEEGRARNRENGQYAEKYDGISTRELSAERERLNLRLEQVENELEGAHGSRYRRLEREAERLYNERSAVEAEILLRGEVYGARPDGIGESAQVSDRPMPVVADDFGNENAPAMGGGDVQSVDNAGAANGYESSAIAQDAALRDYAPENGGAADAGQYGQVRTLGEAANALYQAVRDNENVTARGYNADNYGAQSEKVIRAARLNGGVVSLNAKEWAQVIGFDPANDTSTLRAWLNKALKRQVLDGIAQVNADGKVSSGDVLNFILGEQAYDAAHMAERSRFYNTLNSKSDMEIVNAAPVQYRQDDGRRIKSSELLQLIREKYSTGNMASFENADTGIAVDVRQDGLNETINRASKSDKQGMAAIYSSLYNIGDIIRTSVYVGSQTNYKNDGSSTAIHNFVAAVNIGGELYRAEFNVREIAGGKGTQEKFYFERLTKLDKKTVDARHGTQAASFDTPQRIGVAMQSTNDSIVVTNGDVNTISTNELLKGYNLNDKKMWPLSQVDSETNGGTDDASAAKMGQKNMRKLRGSDILKAVGNVQNDTASLSSDINISQDSENVNGGVNATSGGIYVNGKPLFSGMTDAELDGEIAREADGGRLAELRSERENRTGQENADRRRRDVRLGEIEQMLSDVPRADDTELNMQERYLRRRAAQLDSEIEVARDSGDDVKGLTDELKRTQDNMNAIHAEQQRRAQVRREAGESLINEIRDANPGAARADAQQERERIRQSQQAGREALDALKAERDGRRAWRTTDAISIEEAARVFTDGAGAEVSAPRVSTAEQARETLGRAIDNNPLQAGHEYQAGDYDELIKKVQADGGTHTADEWDRILGFVGNNPRASNLERFVHNTQERALAANDGKTTKAEAKNATVSARELLEFMRNEMASDTANMRLRQKQYERILSHESIPVHVLAETTLTTRDKYADAKGKAQFGDAVNGDTNAVVTLNKEGYSKTVDIIKKMNADVRPAALAALANYKTLIADGIYVGSYPDYGESAYIKQMHCFMHCFVSAFEYGGEQYRAMYTAKESRNGDGTYSTKLYLQRVEALKAQKEQRRLKTLMASSQQGMNYNSTSAANSSIAPQDAAVNTIDAKTTEINFQPTKRML